MPANAAELTIKSVPGGIRLSNSLCHAGLYGSKNHSDHILTSGKPIPSVLAASFRLVCRTMLRNPKLALIDDTADNVIICAQAGEAGPIVSVGIQFLAKVKESRDFAREILIGAIAHEFGHVMQYTSLCTANFHADTQEAFKKPSPCLEDLALREGQDPVILELHADFMAGWLLGSKGLLTTSSFGGFSKYLFSIGDELFGDFTHHGTPRQRLNAMAAGWVYGHNGTIVNDVDTDGILKSMNAHPKDFHSAKDAFVVGQAVLVDFFEGCDDDDCF